MLDLQKFIKLTSVFCLIRDSDSPWVYLVNHRFNLSSRPSSFGPVWCEKSRLKTLLGKMC